jgi:micrococcal nuclease
VYLEKDISERDVFQRLLRYVRLEDGRMVNMILVGEGYAQAATYPPDVKHAEEFVNLQREASDAKRGLWGL